MGISDRIILTLYTIVMAAFAVALVLTTLGMIPAQFFMRIITEWR